MKFFPACTIFIILFISQACAQGESFFIDQNALEELAQKHDRLLIIDVREPHERSGPLGKISGSVNIPLGRLESLMASAGPCPDTVIVLLCRTHNRSQTAYWILKGMGFSSVYVLQGGMMDYSHGRSIPSIE